MVLSRGVGSEAHHRGALFGKCGISTTHDLLLIISALRSKCALGLCFLCIIPAFDTRCQAVSMGGLRRLLLLEEMAVYNRFPGNVLTPTLPQDVASALRFCGFVSSGVEPA